MHHTFHILFLLLSLVCLQTYAQVPIVRPDYGSKTLIAPAYFGPNAFPVPDMLDGRVQKQLHIEAAGDFYLGFERDKTEDIFLRAYIPLFTDRVNLTLWLPVHEWYQFTPERQLTCRLPDADIISGHETGDVFVSTDIQLLRDKRIAPDIALRAALKTASGGSFERARFYDSPGYFFDLSFGKSFYFLGTNPPITDHPRAITERGDSPLELRIAASGGFLCWQTDNGRQNDAVMYGVQVALHSPYLSVKQTFSGYVGWEKAGDRPMILKSEIYGHIHQFSPFVCYQYGLKDYPFHLVRIGLAWEWDILKSRHTK